MARLSVRAELLLTRFLLVGACSVLVARASLRGCGKEERLPDTPSEQLTELLSRSESIELSNRELKAAIEDLVLDQAALMADLKELKARPVTVQNITAVAPGSSETIPGGCPGSYIYRLESGLPVAAHSLSEGEFLATTYDLQVSSTTVNSLQESGQWVSHTQAWITSSGTEDKYPLEIDSSISYVRPKPKLSWAPRVNGGVGLQLFTLEPEASLGVSLVAYGIPEEDKARLLGIRAGTAPSAGIAPVGLNLTSLADLFPLSDLWVWGSIGITPSGWQPGLSIESTF